MATDKRQIALRYCADGRACDKSELRAKEGDTCFRCRRKAAAKSKGLRGARVEAMQDARKLRRRADAHERKGVADGI